MTERSVLLIAYYYPPLGGIGSQRALSFARHLPGHGFRPVVVTSKRGAYGVDPSLDPSAGADIEVVRTGTLEPAVLLRKAKRDGGDDAAGGDFVEGAGGRVAGMARRLLHAAVYYPDHARGWIPAARRAAIRAGKQHGVAAVVSTSPPVSGHLVALRAARALGVPAVLDFRDLWTAHREPGTGGPRAAAERRLEKRLLHRAAAITTVSDAWREWLLRCYSEGPAKPFRVLRNGFEPADFNGEAPAPQDAAFRIVHTGTVDPVRHDLAAFFRAVRAANDRGVFGALHPRLVFAGKVASHTTEAAREAGCGELLELTGFVTHERAVELQRSATVNLLLTWKVPGVISDGHCPGKMYELMAAGRPVLALSLPGCEAVQLLERTGGALVAQPDDEPGIGEALDRLGAAHGKGDARAAVRPRAQDISQFFRSSVAAELAELLASLVA